MKNERTERNDYSYWDYVAKVKRMHNQFGWTAEQISRNAIIPLDTVLKYLAEDDTIPEDSFCKWDAPTRAKIRIMVTRFGYIKASKYLGIPEKLLKDLVAWAKNRKSSSYSVWHETKNWYEQYSYSMRADEIVSWLQEFYPESPYLAKQLERRLKTPVQSTGAWEELKNPPLPMDTVSAAHLIASFRFQTSIFSFTHNGELYHNKKIRYSAKTASNVPIAGIYIPIRTSRRINQMVVQDRAKTIAHLKSLPVGERVLLTMIHRGYQYGIVLTKTETSTGNIRWITSGTRRAITFYPNVPKWAYASLGPNNPIEDYVKPKQPRRRLPKVPQLPTQVEN